MFGLVRDKMTQQYLEEYINEYGLVTRGHISRIMENAGFPDRKIESYHRALFNYGAVNYDKQARLYYSSNYTEANMKRTENMQKVQWVLIDFLGRVEHHFPVASVYTPSYICMMLEDRAYELVYAEKGQEPYLNNQLLASRMELLYRAESTFFSPIVEKNDKSLLEATRYIILLDDMNDAHRIQSPQIAYFCVLNEDNRPVFYTPEDVKAAEVSVS